MLDQTEALQKWAVENGVIARPTATTTVTTSTNAALIPPMEPMVKLSARKPDDLAAMKFDETDNLLGDRMLAKGQFLVIAGPPGIGKSRFVLQLVASLILKKQFLSLDVKNESGPCLILQAENSNRRLMQDTAKLKSAYTADEWKKVNDNLWLHTLEGNHDYLLGLSDPDNVQRLKDLVNEKQPSVVVFDPLYTFGIGDLNQDVDMSETCRKIQEVGHDNNPQRALIILHHALTGKSGINKALGYDKSSYGRNSKLLYSWTRAQINLAPGSAEEHNNKLVVACGKNNNGMSFKTFGAVLNPQTMIYEVNHQFNLKKWQDGVHGKGGREQKAPPEKVAEILGNQRLKKAQLVKRIKEETGVQPATAYEAVDNAKGVTIRRDEETKEYSVIQH